MDEEVDEFTKFKQYLKGLLAKKDDMEKEMKELKVTLKGLGGDVGIPLVDRDGFPKGGLNIHEIRVHRNRFACLQTDYGNVMKEIEMGLGKLHSMKKIDIPSPQMKKKQKSVFKLEPFLEVDMIFENSPVAGTGLKVGDKILKFDYITKEMVEKDGLKLVSLCVSNKKNVKIEVLLERKPQNVTISFVPREWNGKGLLGFHVKRIY